MMPNVLSFVPVAIDTALPELELRKPTVMRLSRAPSLPAPVPVPSAKLARNAPGAGDFLPDGPVPCGLRSPFISSPSIEIPGRARALL